MPRLVAISIAQDRFDSIAMMINLFFNVGFMERLHV